MQFGVSEGGRKRKSHHIDHSFVGLKLPPEQRIEHTSGPVAAPEAHTLKGTRV